ncbi:MAG TPA: ABC transporter ATP-binding protein [Gaiellales bacterium]|jgi:ABC-2 type transport system ATP-binding protein|nr:ABC transporter ATP-binding protein [Gaiellales bacterium]
MTTTAHGKTPVSSVIEIRGLCKDFGEGRGVFDLELDVEPGEILGFLGPNGAGKSTTMRMLLGLIRPTGGRASVLGSDIASGSLEIRRRTGYLAGDFGLYGQLTGRRMLHHLAALHGGVPRPAIDELAERFDASLDRPIRDLSTGNRQKIGLIQALMHRPELLILDEPIAGLDPLVQRNFHELLRRVRAEGRSVFLSSHTLSEVDRVADRVAILRQGRLVVVDRLEHLRALAVRRLDIEFVHPPDPAEFRAIPGVRTVETAGTLLHVSFEGSADAVVKAAAAHEVLSIRSREDELEEIFLRYYQEDAR